MKAELIHNTNDDLSVVNAARVSFNKHSDQLSEKDIKLIQYLARENHFTPFTHNFKVFCIENYFESKHEDIELLDLYMNASSMAGCKIRKEYNRGYADNLLIGMNVYFFIQNEKYVPYSSSLNVAFLESFPETLKAFNNYNEDFRYKNYYELDEIEDSRFIFDTFRIKVPIAVARQLDKHQVGFTKNEVSRRYVNYEPEFYMPEVWRKQATDKKQSSLDEAVTQLSHEEDVEDLWGDIDNNFHPSLYVDNTIYHTQEMYKWLIKSEVCAEQARFVLPQSMYTEYYLSACLEDWNRLLKLRLKNDTQKETREVAAMIRDELNKKYDKKMVQQ